MFNPAANALVGYCNTIPVDVVRRTLGQVVLAVDGRCEIFLDGGIRRGTDVLKALALGATAVFIGRPVIWGLAHSVSVCTILISTVVGFAHYSMFSTLR